MSESELHGLSDDELVTHLGALCAEDCALKAQIVGYLIEVEVRELHLRRACSSMHDFCTRLMNMSQSMTFRRLAAARIVRQYPCFMKPLARGEVHIETLLVLRRHLTPSNAEELLAASRGKSVQEVELVLAALVPKPDVPSTIVACAEEGPLPGPARSGPSRVTPLSPSRYEVKFTASQGLCDKLARAQDLMRHRNPGGDIAIVFENALDVLMTKLEKELRGKTDRPRRTTRSRRPGAVLRGARSDVFARDGEQCTFEDGKGNRCPARRFLELDHIAARALGGTGEVGNLRVLCGPHNRLVAKDTFGHVHVQRRVGARRARTAAKRAAAASPSVSSVEPTTTVADDLGLIGIVRGATFDVECPVAPEASPRSPDAAATTQDESHVIYCARALEGLVRLGFKRAEAARALDTVVGRHGVALGAGALPGVLRDALRLLT